MIEPSKTAITRGLYKRINGEWHKLCTGPAHDEPVYLPATVKYFYARAKGARDGEFLSRCRLCQNWDRVKSPGSARGLVPVARVRHFYDEAVTRIGRMELSRRTGLSYDAISAVLDGQRKHVRKANLRLVMLELISMQRKDERHDSAYLRLADRKREAAKAAARLKIRQRRDFDLGIHEEHLAVLYPVKSDSSDPQWWHHTGQEWLPRYGEEMLGAEF